MVMGLKDKQKQFLSSKRKIVRNKDEGTAFQRYIKSLFHAIDGMIYATICEHNMIIIILAIILVTIAGFAYQISEAEWLFCLLMFGTVSAAEFTNTAIEAVVDLVSPDFNKLAKIAKDTASSATLILSITALIGAIIIFIPKMLKLI